MMLKKLLILFSFLIVVPAWAQDAFEQIFKGNDVERLDKAEKWYLTYSISPDSAVSLPWLKHMLAQATEHDDEVLILATRFQLAFYYVSVLRQEDPWLEEMYNVMEQSRDDYEYLAIDFLDRLGLLEYQIRQNYSKGLRLQLQAYEMFREKGMKRPVKAAILQYELARVYYQLANYEKSIEVAQPVSRNTGTSEAMSYLRLQTLNMIGLSYRNLKKDDSTLLYFNKTLDAAKTDKDTPWIGIASVNIAKYYISHGQYDKASPYAQTRYQYSIVNDDRLTAGDSCEALIVLAKIDAHYGQAEKAIDKLTRAMHALKPSGRAYNWSKHYDLQRDLYFQLSDIYYKNGNAQKGFEYSIIGDHYEDSVDLVKKQAQELSVHTEVEAEKQLQLLKETEMRTYQAVMNRNLMAIVLALTGLLLFILYKRQRLKTTTDKQLFENRQQLLFIAKSRAEEQLSSYINLLQEKNKLLESFDGEVIKLKETPDSAEKAHMIETLETLQRTAIVTEKDWLAFRTLFEKAYSGFFSRLKEKYPDITPAEMRIFALTKLSLSTKDQANLLGISPASLRKTRYRFLRKLNQNKEDGEADFEKIVAGI
jgi:tetratricopeptide (TPR) repeat protein